MRLTINYKCLDDINKDQNALKDEANVMIFFPCFLSLSNMATENESLLRHCRLWCYLHVYQITRCTTASSSQNHMTIDHDIENAFRFSPKYEKMKPFTRKYNL